MSWSKPLEGEKRKFFALPSKDPAPKKCKLAIGKRKCIALGCKSDQASHALFTFPATTRVVRGQQIICKESTERLKIWVKNCGSKDVAKHPLNILHGKYYLCSNHFVDKYFTSHEKKRLVNTAIPTVFLAQNNCEHASSNTEENSLDHPSTSGETCKHIIEEINDSFNAVQLQDGNTQVNHVLHDHSYVTGSEHNGCEQAELASTSVQSSSCNIDQNRYNFNELQLENNITQIHQVSHDHSYFKGSEHHVKAKAKQTFKCCMKGCVNTSNEHTMFHFPKITSTTYELTTKIQMSNFHRFKKWIVNCGNNELFLMSPSCVHQKYLVCDAHFEQSSFSSKNRLKHDAVPTVKLNPILSETLINEYYTNMDKWRETLDEQIFQSDESCAYAFEEDMHTINWSKCEHCKEKVLKSSKKEQLKCLHGSKCWEYSVVNNMDPGNVPEELQNLSFVEQQLIARVHPQIIVYKIKGHQYAYRGNVISFPQDVNRFATQLPHQVKDLQSIIVVRYENSSGKYHDFNIRSARVRRALQWLKQNNPHYKDIDISEENLNNLPIDGNVFDDMQKVIIADDEDKNEIEDESDDDFIEHTGVPNMATPHQDDVIKDKLAWPTISNLPLNERQTPGFVACAFPTLFPHGTADLNDSRKKEVKTGDYFRHLINYYDDRFAKHETFRFFAYNLWLRWSALNDGNIFVKNNPEFQNMTVSQLKEKIAENPNIMKQVMFQGSNLKGTKSYWHQRANELKDMVEQLGMPTIFLTLSCADGHWEDLYRLLTDKDVTSLTEAERRQLVQDNPHIVDSFFAYRVEAFIKHVMQTKFKVVDYWYRIEYQHRGSPHLHGIFWVQDAPDVSNIEEASEEYVKEVIEYFSELVEAWNPDVNASDPDTHPCRTSYSNILDFEEDLAQLLHKVQRHTKCSTDYCYKVNKKKNQRECRFKFPREMQDEATLTKNENGEFEFNPKRNDPRMNKFNKFIIQLWRANMDIAPVISKRALLAYLAKYISKSEVQSQTLQDIFQTVIEKLDDDLVSKKVIHKVLMKSCAERDISAQEVMHSLLRLKLYSAGGRNFVTINMSEKKWMQIHDEESENIHGKNILEKYQERPDRLSNKSLWDCAKMYNVNTWRPVNKNNIVRVFPKISKKENEETNEAYYRQNVLLHLPWRNEGDIKSDAQTWHEIFMMYNIEENVKRMNKMQTSDTHEDSEYESEENYSNDEDEGLTEGLLASRMGPKTDIPIIELGNRDVDLNFNWQETYKKYEQYGTIADFENFIDDMKKKNTNQQQGNHEVPNVTLSKDQQEIIDVIKDQIKVIKDPSLRTTENNDIKRIIIQGKAGTGKSLIIKYITALLNEELGNDSYMLATPTGVSAVLINGKTLHSVFKIPKKSDDYKPLKGEAARNLCNKMSNVKFLILDEYSMIGCKTLAIISKRCKEATGNHEEDFGGINVLLLGDIKQLPPIKDNSFYSKTQKSLLGKEGKAIIMKFEKAFFLSTCHRQEDMNFLKTLDNLSELKTTKEDYDFLSTRFIHKQSEQELQSFENAIRLFATKDEVKEYNIKKLSELRDEQSGLSVPVAKIEAKHNCSAAKKESSDNAEGLERVVYLAKGCHIMLRKNLWIEEKLCNGTMGKVVDIIYDKSSDFPSVVLCEFENYEGPSLVPGSKFIPVKPILTSWTDSNGNNCTRLQFPISLSYACSIHKSQGMTLNKVVVDIGNHDFALGLSYVAMTRVRRIDDLLIQPFNHQRLKPTNHILTILEIRQEFLNYLQNKI